MTADAKVGLLLGLFFIVLIAFLVNGFPSFLQSATAEDVVKTTSIAAPSGPDLVIDNRMTEAAQRLTPGVPLRATEPPQEVIVLDSGAQTPPVAAEPVTPEPVPVVDIKEARQMPPQPTPVAVREHVVERGETLASIAQKYYGAEQGNRRAVIQKLYEANRSTLSSPDKVLVGSTLAIPSLQETAPAQTSPTQTLLQRFSNMFERAPEQPQAVRVAAPRTTEYVVQPGDSLWKIAEKTLGNGSKFETLLEMNKDRLKDADDVVAGMKLVVPVP